MDIQKTLEGIRKCNFKLLARAISIIENESEGYENILQALPSGDAIIIGITGPPGAGKSTLTDALIGCFVSQKKKIAVLCVDPSSPFTRGALLGDRVRMNKWYNHDDVFIRSFATRGSLGGLNPKMIEVTELLKAASFDYILIETVGVGQSEVEIAGLADITAVVLVPEAGDDIQAMKAGLMEIADIFVVNKCDRPGAELFEKNLLHLLRPGHDDKNKRDIPVVKTIALQNQGIDELAAMIESQQLRQNNHRKILLLTEKAYQLIAQKLMHGVHKNELTKKIEQEMEGKNFNLYQFVKNYK